MPKVVGQPIVLLTGAGASKEIGYPLTDELLTRFQQGPVSEEARFVLGVVPSESELEQNFELLRSYLFEIGRLNAADEVSLVEILAKYGLQDHLEPFKRNGLPPIITSHERLDNALSQLILKTFSGESIAHPDSIWSPVRTWSGVLDYFAMRLGPDFLLPIFTTNYDPSLDLLNGQWSFKGKSLNVRSHFTDDRFQRYRHGFAERVAVPTIFSCHLHGKPDYYKFQDIIDGTSVISRHNTANPPLADRLIVQPRLNFKGEQLKQEPFKTFYSAFDECLQAARLLVLIGHSLRDIELVEVVRNRLVSNQALKLIWVNPEASSNLNRITAGQRELESRIVPVECYFPQDSQTIIKKIDEAFAG